MWILVWWLEIVYMFITFSLQTRVKSIMRETNEIVHIYIDNLIYPFVLLTLLIMKWSKSIFVNTILFIYLFLTFFFFLWWMISLMFNLGTKTDYCTWLSREKGSVLPEYFCLEAKAMKNGMSCIPMPNNGPSWSHGLE
jgi:hypothetical protein